MRAIFALVALLTAGLALAEPNVGRANFTTGVENFEPVDELVSPISDTHKRVFFFSDLRDSAGHQIAHRWYYDDTLMAELVFNPAGPRWRVKSYKTMLPIWHGPWRVDVVDLDNNDAVLGSWSFDYVDAQAFPNAN